MSQSIIHEGGSASEEQISHYFTPAYHETLSPGSSPPAMPQSASPPIGAAKVGSEFIYATEILKKIINKITPSKQQVGPFGGRFLR